MSFNTGGISNYASAGIIKTSNISTGKALQANQLEKTSDNSPAAIYTPSNQETLTENKTYNAFGKLNNSSTNVASQNQLSTEKNATALSGDTAFQRVNTADNSSQLMSLPYIPNPVTRPPVTHQGRLVQPPHYNLNPVILRESPAISSANSTNLTENKLQTEAISNAQQLSNFNLNPDILRENATVDFANSANLTNLTENKQTEAISNAQRLLGN